MNKTKGNPADERAIAPGIELLLCCLVGESVGRGNMKVLSEVADSAWWANHCKCDAILTPSSQAKTGALGI